VGAAFRQLGHPPEFISIFQNCQASLGLNWEDSLELRGVRLQNYGEVPEDAKQAMDGLAAQLSGLFLGMRQAMGEPHRP
jgi:hypothetical protein